MSSMKHYTEVASKGNGRDRAFPAAVIVQETRVSTRPFSLCAPREIGIEESNRSLIEFDRRRRGRRLLPGVQELISAALFLRLSDFSKPRTRNAP